MYCTIFSNKLGFILEKSLFITPKAVDKHVFSFNKTASGTIFTTLVNSKLLGQFFSNKNVNMEPYS